MTNPKHPSILTATFITFLLWLLMACDSTRDVPVAVVLSQTSSDTGTPTITHQTSDIQTPTLTNTPSQTPTLAPSEIPTLTRTPSNTPIPTITLTPTFDYPDVTVTETAHCRYGPGIAYLHAADLYEGDQGQLWNRNYPGTWVWVKFDKLNYACWVAASLVQVQGDIFSVTTYYHPLPKSTYYEPVKVVVAERQGDSVVVRWDEVWMTEDDFRGYLIEAQVCQNGFFIDVAYHSDKSPITIWDERTCNQESNGKLYAVEKHGYTDPISIPWP